MNGTGFFLFLMSQSANCHFGLRDSHMNKKGEKDGYDCTCIQDSPIASFFCEEWMKQNSMV